MPPEERPPLLFHIITATFAFSWQSAVISPPARRQAAAYHFAYHALSSIAAPEDSDAFRRAAVSRGWRAIVAAASPAAILFDTYASAADDESAYRCLFDDSLFAERYRSYITVSKWLI